MKCAIGLLALAGLILSGCTTTRSEAAAKVKDADERMVANCAFLKTISERSAGLGATAEMENAKTRVLGKAARAGATHIGWGSLYAAVSGSRATGRAYRCPEAPK